MNCDLKIVCSVNEKVNNVKNIIRKYSKCDTIMVVIGPEGGFDPSEADALMNASGANVYTATLGKRILRTETAPIAAIAAIMFATGNMD